VHHAIRTVKLQLQDKTATSGRWVIEGDLASYSYIDTVHHKLLMKCVRKRIRDTRFLTLLWRFIKAGHIDKGLFRAASEGVPQGGVASPLLSNIMLNEFDQWLEAKYLGKKARTDRWYWNDSIKRQRPIALRKNRQWLPVVAYCRYADDFVVIVKGNSAYYASGNISSCYLGNVGLDGDPLLNIDHSLASRSIAITSMDRDFECKFCVPLPCQD